MDKEKIIHLAKLAKIELTNEEIEKMQNEFKSILWFIDKLQSISTDGVEMMYTPVLNLNLDYKKKSNTKVSSDDLLANSSNKIENNMIVIKSSTVEH